MPVWVMPVVASDCRYLLYFFQTTEITVGHAGTIAPTLASTHSGSPFLRLSIPGWEHGYGTRTNVRTEGF